MNKSHNTLEYVYFHDNVIKKVEYDKKTLTLHFDWFTILETHPNNETDTYKQINNGVVYFEKVKVITSHWHDHDKIRSIYFLDALNNLEVIDLKVIKAGDKFICKIDGWNNFQYNQISFKYSDSYECFKTDS